MGFSYCIAEKSALQLFQQASSLSQEQQYKLRIAYFVSNPFRTQQSTSKSPTAAEGPLQGRCSFQSSGNCVTSLESVLWFSHRKMYEF
jgi:hypothetical protein